MEKHTNRLIHESSPYLLQHAHNPVDWFPWGTEAFHKAETENKPVLISIGYSACHWCHVMEKEVFENSAAAAYMNEHFVCIKVDREERPDVDHTYMDAVHLMGQRGGWPLNVFTLADGRPVYGGTYFPLERWLQILENLADLFANERDKVYEYSRALEDGLKNLEQLVAGQNSQFDTRLIHSLTDQWGKHLDMAKGGAARAPKFPMPSHLLCLMNYAHCTGENGMDAYVRVTLDEMAKGGIYDHAEGGFARYSVDDEWKLPHFEKMLYDNAQLISVYAQAFARFGEPMYRRVAEETIRFVIRHWKSGNGLLYSATDADSEGEEGRYYVWKEKEIKDLLKDQWENFLSLFHLDEKSLWEQGRHILLRRNNDREWREKWGHPQEVLEQRLRTITNVLLDERKKRPAPAKDNKTLTSWNAMFVRALADSYAAFGEETYLHQAIDLADLLKARMIDEKGELVRCFSGNKAIPAFLEDYAFLIDALVRLYEVTGKDVFVRDAVSYAEQALNRFGDPHSFTLWYSRPDPLTFQRKKEIIDNVIPSSNAVMAINLFRLSRLTDRREMEERCRNMISEVLPQIDHASSYTQWLQLMTWISTTCHEIVITGPGADEALREILRKYLPNTLTAASTTDSSLPVFAGRISDELRLYVCTNKSCSLPQSNVESVWPLLQ